MDAAKQDDHVAVRASVAKTRPAALVTTWVIAAGREDGSVEVFYLAQATAAACIGHMHHGDARISAVAGVMRKL